MSHKVVKDALGVVVCFGPDVPEYVPVLEAGHTLEVIVDFIPPQPNPQIAINASSREYLLSTDWYVVRLTESGIAIPQPILDARALARAAVI